MKTRTFILGGILVVSIIFGIGALAKRIPIPEKVLAAHNIEESNPVIIELDEEETEQIKDLDLEDEKDLEKVLELVESKLYYDVPLSDDLQDHIFDECEKYGLDEEVMFGLIQTESNFTSDVVSSTNDYGLCQINGINKGWLREIGVTDLLDPYQNVTAGVYILSTFLEKTKDIEKALICYNFGEGGAKKACFSKGIYSTSYSRKVLQNAEEIEVREGE